MTEAALGAACPAGGGVGARLPTRKQSRRRAGIAINTGYVRGATSRCWRPGQRSLGPPTAGWGEEDDRPVNQTSALWLRVHQGLLNDACPIDFVSAVVRELAVVAEPAIPFVAEV